MIHPLDTLFFGLIDSKIVFLNESDCQTQFFLEYCVTTKFASQGPEWWSRQWHEAQDMFPAIQWLLPPL